jgi:hypothetical protein
MVFDLETVSLDLEVMDLVIMDTLPLRISSSFEKKRAGLCILLRVVLCKPSISLKIVSFPSEWVTIID